MELPIKLSTYTSLILFDSISNFYFSWFFFCFICSSSNNKLYTRWSLSRFDRSFILVFIVASSTLLAPDEMRFRISQIIPFNWRFALLKIFGCFCFIFFFFLHCTEFTDQNDKHSQVFTHSEPLLHLSLTLVFESTNEFMSLEWQNQMEKQNRVTVADSESIWISFNHQAPDDYNGKKKKNGTTPIYDRKVRQTDITCLTNLRQRQSTTNK